MRRILLRALCCAVPLLWSAHVEAACVGDVPNGTVESEEECDDGDASDANDCKSDCTLAVCGDGILKSAGMPPLEDCDDGAANSDTGTCTLECKSAACGDGNPCAEPGCTTGSGGGPEDCDDGNATDTDGCHNDCTLGASPTIDELFADIATQVPEFGGMYLDRDRLQIYLTDPSPDRLAAAEAAVISTFGAAVVPEKGIAARRAKNGFLQLRDWYAQMIGAVSSIPGVVITDINERRNRLEIGLETRGDTKRQVQEALAAQGIPRRAVKIRVTGPIVPASHTLQSTISPREGGYQIVSSGGFCTLGFTAWRAGVAGFVTNSHCAAPPHWAVGGTAFNQATTTFVGTETVDPPGFVGAPCPPGRTCRRSDSLFATYATGIAFDLGAVGRTTGVTVNWAMPNITVAHGVINGVDQGRFRIVGPPSLPYLVGTRLDKVGRRTGWGKGKIIQSCVGTVWPVPGPPNPWLVCQDVVINAAPGTNGIVNEGDSGSPVFRVLSSAQCLEAELYGILWGRYVGTHAYFLFSRIPSVQAELGALTYANPSYVGTTTITLHTGANGLPPGASDGRWCLTQAPPFQPCAPPPARAAIGVSPVPQWVTLPGSRWLASCQACGAPTASCPSGDYIYEMCWTQCGKLITSIPVRIAADDGAQVFMVHNGVQSPTPLATIPAQSPFGSTPTQVALTDPGSGKNCLRVYVANSGGPTGLNVSGVISGSLSPCSACGVCP